MRAYVRENRSESSEQIIVSLSPKFYKELVEEAREERLTIEDWARCILGQWLIFKRVFKKRMDT
jgi:hypothetical protein